MILDALVHYAQVFGIFDKLKNKFIAQPDPAAKHLADVLGDLADMFNVIDTEVANYLSIWFDANNPNQVAKERKKLYELEGGKVGVRMSKARAHCHKIRTIYDKYLDKWFSSVLDRDEYDRISLTFRILTESDLSFVYWIDDLSEWLEKRAGSIQKILDKKNYTLANEEIQKDRKKVLPKRKKMSKIMKKLYKLQADYVQFSKTL